MTISAIPLSLVGSIPDDSHWGAIVIGSGMGGLTAAAYLAANGVRTLVLEAGDTIGGCTHVFRRNGFEFEVGVHYLGSCGSPEGNIPTVLRGLGLDKRIDFREIDADGFDQLRFRSVDFAVPRGWDNYEERLLAQFPEQQAALRRYVKIIRRLADAVDLASTGSGTDGAVRFARKAGPYAALGMLPLDALVRMCGVTGMARTVVCGQTPAYAAAARRAPALVQAGYLKIYVGGGAYFPQGGGQMLSASLAEAITANGGAIALRSVVNRIHVENCRVSGVSVEAGRTFHAPIVVSAADLKKTFRDLVGAEHIPARDMRRVANYRMAWPLFNVYLGLDTDLADRFTSAQIWRFRFDGDFGVSQRRLDFRRFNGDREAWLQECRTYLGAMIHMASIKDPVSGLAPAGQSSIEVMTYVPADPELWGLAGLDPTVDETYRSNPTYQYMKDQVTDILVSVAEDVIPDIREHIVWLEAGSPATQQRYTRSTDGGSYGVEMSWDQVGPRRQGPRTPVGGLFVAGASSAWGPGVEGTMLSGIGAAGAVLNRNLIREVRDGAVFGDVASLPERDESWDPLAVSTTLAVKGSKRRSTAR